MRKKKLDVGIIGLGKFGLCVGQELMKLGHNVIGADKSKERINLAKESLTQVYQTDIIDKITLSQIGFTDLTHALISVGDSITVSALVAMNLLEIGVPNIWVKAVNSDHQKLLHKLGNINVIIPENLAAVQLANQMAIPGFIENLSFSTEMGIMEIIVDKWAGKQLKELDLTNIYGLQIIAIGKISEKTIRYVPRADDILEANDKLIIIGNIEDLSQLDT